LACFAECLKDTLIPLKKLSKAIKSLPFLSGIQPMDFNTWGIVTAQPFWTGAIESLQSGA
jgi:hypothetical protein